MELLGMLLTEQTFGPATLHNGMTLIQMDMETIHLLLQLEMDALQSTVILQ